jgi:hypothetical protein
MYLYPRALGLLFVASYYSQGCGGVILTQLLTASPVWLYSLGTDIIKNTIYDGMLPNSGLDIVTCLLSHSLTTDHVITSVF